jgi:ATP-binding cassette subfamily B protein
MQKQIIALLWKTAMRYPVRTLGAIFGSTISLVVGTFIGPYIISEVLNQLQNGALTLDSSLPLIIAYSATQFYGQLIGWRINLFFIWTMEAAAEQDLYQRVLSTLTAQSLRFHSDRFGGALVSQTTKLIGSFEKFWDTMIFQLIPSVTSVIAATAILSFVFWQYAVFLFVLSVVFTIAVVLGSKFLMQRNKEEAQASTAVNGFVADVVTNITTIKSHGHENRENATLHEKTDIWRDKTLSTMRGFLTVSSVYSFIISVLNIVALIGAIWASEHHIVAIGAVYLCITYTFTVSRQLWEINSIMRNYNRIMGDAHDMTEILDLEPEITDRSNTSLVATKGAISFQNVTFSHPDSDGPLFKKFSLNITPGEHIGLVGHSGSGKTTLTRLLLRFSDIESGSVTIDGQDISRVTQASLRKHIAYVPQEPMLFHRSLRENIAYGKPDASDAEILEAAKKANALEFIVKLPQGLETMVGERGIKLSGGQRQRIAIARAILKDAPVLLLDEATSALDSESEKLIQDALTKLMKNRTSIVIAHRLSTIAQLDRILVLEDGIITEQGTHDSLLKNKQTYAKLWSHQSGGFIEE